eukprot:957666-Prymnesium_polylepis.1
MYPPAGTGRRAAQCKRRGEMRERKQRDRATLGRPYLEVERTQHDDDAERVLDERVDTAIQEELEDHHGRNLT